MVLHQLKQGVHGLPAEVVAAAGGGADQAVGFVDEQHAVQRQVDGVADLDGGVSDVAGHQGGAVGLDQVVALEVAQAVQDLAHEAGDGGLAGAGVAEEHAMQGRRLGGTP